MSAELREKIARALFLHENPDPGISWAETRAFPRLREQYMDAAAAVRPIVEAEVSKAKAEAWREYAAALEAVPDYARTEYDRGRVDQRHATVEELHARATEYETGDTR